MRKVEYIMSIIVYRILAFFFLMPAIFGLVDFIGVHIFENSIKDLIGSKFWFGTQIYPSGFDNNNLTGAAAASSNLPIFISLMAIAGAILLSKKIN